MAVQVAFPFTLFNRRVKNVLLAAMITEHISIAVLLGLPFFSMAMIAADAVFLPTVAPALARRRASPGGRQRLLDAAGVRARRRSNAAAARSPVTPERRACTAATAPLNRPVPPQQRSGDGVSVR